MCELFIWLNCDVLLPIKGIIQVESGEQYFAAKGIMARHIAATVMNEIVKNPPQDLRLSVNVTIGRHHVHRLFTKFYMLFTLQFRQAERLKVFWFRS